MNCCNISIARFNTQFCYNRSPQSLCNPKRSIKDRQRVEEWVRRPGGVYSPPALMAIWTLHLTQMKTSTWYLVLDAGSICCCWNVTRCSSSSKKNDHATRGKRRGRRRNKRSSGRNINQVFERHFLFPPQRLKALKMNEWLRICKNSPTDRFRSFRIVRNVKPVFADQ